MDKKSYPDIFRLNIDIRYISRYFFRKVRANVQSKSKPNMTSQVVLLKPAISVNSCKIK